MYVKDGDQHELSLEVALFFETRSLIVLEFTHLLNNRFQESPTSTPNQPRAGIRDQTPY